MIIPWIVPESKAVSRKRVVFLSGTRADFGKLKSLIRVLSEHRDRFDVHVFATGMHLDPKYGETIREIEKCGFECEIFPHLNQASSGALDRTLANTVLGFGDFVRLRRPDLVVVHGDRSEALAGAVVAATNNILVAHIEGGEVSGTIDEILRHAVSKMSHLHFVSNVEARRRLLQLGEEPDAIHVIGSPDIDLLNSPERPSIDEVRCHYDIPFREYGVLVWHPVTTNLGSVRKETQGVVAAVVGSERNWIVIYPNSDPGSDVILAEYDRGFTKEARFRVFPSLRFESMLVLLENARVIVGNSSMGIGEAPYYGTPTVDVGTRQAGRSDNPDILHVDAQSDRIREAIDEVWGRRFRTEQRERGTGDSHEQFRAALSDERLWSTPVQKRFRDVPMAAEPFRANRTRSAA